MVHNSKQSAQACGGNDTSPRVRLNISAWKGGSFTLKMSQGHTDVRMK